MSLGSVAARRRCSLGIVTPVSVFNVTLTSEVLGRDFQLKVSASALRTVNKVGGLDPFLRKSAIDNLSSNAMKIKRDIDKTELEKGSN